LYDVLGVVISKDVAQNRNEAAAAVYTNKRCQEAEACLV
jgi:hypothetical protein